MDYEPFVRALSYRDFLSAAVLCLVLIASNSVLDFLDINVSVLVVIISVFFSIVLLHVVYRLEHRRSNNFAGRLFHDVIYFLMLFILSKLNGWYETGELYLELDDPVTAIFGFLILIFLLEGIMALLQRLFNVLRWQIL